MLHKLVSYVAHPRAHHCAEAAYVVQELSHTHEARTVVVLIVLLAVVIVDALYQQH